mmetsp:Transcript_18917/g.31724  ORF Transcript_18917/g.31724 Transcript_18917/m.31724 type:complete len:127 (-) Transcript_18917:3-383(-)
MYVRSGQEAVTVQRSSNFTELPTVLLNNHLFTTHGLQVPSMSMPQGHCGASLKRSRAKRCSGTWGLAPSTKSAAASPIAGPNLNPWPLNPPNNTILLWPGTQSTTKSVSGVVVYKHRTTSRSVWDT